MIKSKQNGEKYLPTRSSAPRLASQAVMQVHKPTPSINVIALRQHASENDLCQGYHIFAISFDMKFSEITEASIASTVAVCWRRFWLQQNTLPHIDTHLIVRHANRSAWHTKYEASVSSLCFALWQLVAFCIQGKA